MRINISFLMRCIFAILLKFLMIFVESLYRDYWEPKNGESTV